LFGDEVDCNVEDIRSSGNLMKGTVIHLSKQQDIPIFFNYTSSVLSGVVTKSLGTDYVRFAFPDSTSPPYQVRWRLVEDEAEEAKMEIRKENDFREVTIKNLKPETEYYFQFNFGGSSQWSEPTRIMTLIGIPLLMFLTMNRKRLG
jgi:hypothetical protein